MSTYQIKTPRGIYQLDGPDGASRDDLLATLQAHVPDAFTRPEDHPVSDTLNYMKQGFGSTVQAAGAAFGVHNPVTDWAQGVKDSATFSEAEKLRQQRADEIEKSAVGKGIFSESLAKLHAIATDPKALAGQFVGGAAPLLALPVAAAFLPEAAVGGAGAAGLGALATALDVGGGALGAVAGAGGIKQSMYDAVKTELKVHGAPDDQAERAAIQASSYAGPNSALIAGGGLLGIVGGVTGLGNRAMNAVVSKVAARIAGENVAGAAGAEAAADLAAQAVAKKEVEDIAKDTVGKTALKDFAKEAAIGGAFMGFQKYGTNVALANAGVPTDPMQGVAGEVIGGGLGSGLIGAMAGAGFQTLARRNARNAGLAKDAVPQAEQAIEQAKGPSSAEVQRLQRLMGFTREQAERQVADTERIANAQAAADASAPAAAAVAAGEQPVVRGAKPDVSGVGREPATAEPTRAAATPEAGRLEATGTDVADVAGAERTVDTSVAPPTKESVRAEIEAKSTLKDFKASDKLVDTVHEVMATAHEVGKPISIDDALKAARSYEPPKFNDVTTAAKAAAPEGVKITRPDVTAIRNTVIASRGAVSVEDATTAHVAKKYPELAPKAPEAAPISAPEIAETVTPIIKEVANQLSPEDISARAQAQSDLNTLIETDKTSAQPKLNAQQVDELTSDLADGEDPRTVLTKAKDMTAEVDALAAAAAAATTQQEPQGLPGEPLSVGMVAPREETPALEPGAAQETPALEPGASEPIPVEEAPRATEAVSEDGQPISLVPEVDEPTTIQQTYRGMEHDVALNDGTTVSIRNVGTLPDPDWRVDDPNSSDATSRINLGPTKREALENLPVVLAKGRAEKQAELGQKLEPDNAVSDDKQITDDAQVQAKASVDANNTEQAERAAKPKAEVVKDDADKLSADEKAVQKITEKEIANSVAFSPKAKPADVEEVLGTMGNGLRAHNGKDFEHAIDDIGEKDDNGIPAFARFLPEPLFRFFNRPLLTSSIVNLYRDALPNLDRFLEWSQEKNGYHQMRTKAFNTFGLQVEKFIKQNGPDVLAHGISVTKATGVDFLAYDTAQEYKLHDPAVLAYTKALTDPARMTKKGEARKLDRSKLDRRNLEINIAYNIRDKLAEQPGGLEIYRDIRDFHQYAGNIIKSLMADRIRGSGITDPAEADKLIADVTASMDFTNFNATKTGMHAVYSLVPAKDMPNIYFPSKRFGNYWLGVKESPAGRQFHMFDTKGDLMAAKERLAKLYKVKNNDVMFEWGDKRDGLRLAMQNDDAKFNKVMKILDESKFAGTDEQQKAQREGLRDDLFQAHLESMPERSFSKSLIHYKDITGASPDVLRSLGSSMQQLATRLTSMKYGPQLNHLVQDLHEHVRPPDGSQGPFSQEMTNRLEYVIHLLREREEASLSPAPMSMLIQNANRAAVLMYMTSPASAVANHLGLLFRTYPMLTFDHNPIAATRAMLRYGNVFDSMGFEKIGAKGELELTVPSVSESALVRGNADRMAAREDFEQHGTFNTGTEIQVGTEAYSRTDPVGRADNYARKVTKALTFGLQFSEKTTRELAAYMAFDLQLPKELKKGGTRQEAQQRAAAYARKVTRETLGDPNASEYPHELQQGWGRVLGLFKRFSFQQTKFQLGSLYHAARALSKGNIAESARLTGELGMSLGLMALFGGVVGLPGYGLYMGLVDAYDNIFLTPEERKERKKIYGKAATNADMRFRYFFLPKYFGGATLRGPDGYEHSVNNMLLNGPVSELTDINFAPKVSVDGLWFRGLQGGNNLGEVVTNTLVANIAPFSAQENMIKGIDQFGDGQMVRGAEKFMPAGIKGALTAFRYGTEGMETVSGKSMLAKDDFTPGNLFGVMLGFQPTKAATIQTNHYMLANEMKAANQTRSKLMQDYVYAWTNQNRDAGQLSALEARRKAFNAKYPFPDTLITQQTLNKSYKSALKDRASSYRGTTRTMKNYRDIDKVIRPSVPVIGGTPRTQELVQ